MTRRRVVGRQPNTKRLRAKQVDIEAALAISDVGALRRLALSEYGLVSSELRARAWPMLLNVRDHMPNYAAQIAQHRDIGQVALDISRSFWRFPTGINTKQREALRKDCSDVLNALLSLHPELYYYQGLHEFAAVLMLESTPADAFDMMLILAQCHIRDFMESSLAGALAYLELIFPIVHNFDPELHAFLLKSGVHPHVCISWVLTWFSHDLDSLSDVARVFDVCLSNHPLMCVYLSAAMICMRRDHVLAAKCEYSAVHKLLATIPTNLHLEELISMGVRFREEFPPQQLLKVNIPNPHKQQLSLCKSFGLYRGFVEALGARERWNGQPGKSTSWQETAMLITGLAISTSLWALSMFYDRLG
eukprot:m.183263 g.183263  ORF g.183263 m.183263 type:complete len:362 (-) comp17473_c1_seq2:231-1316(-)